MNFRAKLKRNSATYRNWIGASRVGGSISGVMFKRSGRDFISADDPLPGEAVSSMLGNAAVELEISTALAGEVAAFGIVDDDPSPGVTPDADPDPLASLWRRGDPTQEPVMRRRGRPPGPR